MASREGARGADLFFLDTRGLRPASSLFSKNERERERERRQKRREQKKTSIYLEQLRRPGAEAVGLPEVEGPEVRVERFVDLVGVWEEKGGERKEDEVSVKRTTPRDFSERERCRRDEDEKRERNQKNQKILLTSSLSIE